MVDVSQMPAGSSADALFVEVYARLKAMASRRLAAQRRNGTLDTTKLQYAYGQGHAQLQRELPRLLEFIAG